MLKILRRSLLVLLACLPFTAHAAATPQQLVQSTTDQVLGELTSKREQFKQDPEAFYQALDGILGPVIDFDGFARGVMTVRYSRQASPEQMQAFQTSFKRSLVKFYGSALLEYDNQQIRMLPPVASREPDRASVNMEVVGRSGAIYPLTYTLEQKGGAWKVRNVIINGINIGKLFRDQFAESMRSNGNDLDKVIATWGDAVARAQEAADVTAGQQ
ncbi:phospholipid transport system substrate-binding protein [Pseudomonas linyingensis]|jgi:phospholipid transport system substrate-binding protein|uniref:Phospholipid transport system substrate-binding protein n=1 Tax=Pseudomonas linyingensis TaxID=915471 RepID=A0A1H6SJ42_9PSED|nr:ABC transporter substrate-binding protein [Pseudomonas linyingensis]MCM2319330.1 ABC transporter substrate-binding protein [Pseudomonas sp.]SEI63795.1 phospholipid transport system substrate-binding protein [Pseudomonas linyingensis]